MKKHLGISKYIHVQRLETYMYMYTQKFFIIFDPPLFSLKKMKFSLSIMIN